MRSLHLARASVLREGQQAVANPQWNPQIKLTLYLQGISPQFRLLLLLLMVAFFKFQKSVDFKAEELLKLKFFMEAVEFVMEKVKK